jgi:hypothetical protein
MVSGAPFHDKMPGAFVGAIGVLSLVWPMLSCYSVGFGCVLLRLIGPGLYTPAVLVIRVISIIGFMQKLDQ